MRQLLYTFVSYFTNLLGNSYSHALFQKDFGNMEFAILVVVKGVHRLHLDLLNYLGLYLCVKHLDSRYEIIARY